MNDKINALTAACKGGLSIHINEHRAIYQTIKQYVDEIDGTDISPEIKNKIIETGTIVEIIFYPDTPVGFFKVYHYSVDLALDLALDIIEQK